MFDEGISTLNNLGDNMGNSEFTEKENLECKILEFCIDCYENVAWDMEKVGQWDENQSKKEYISAMRKLVADFIEVNADMDVYVYYTNLSRAKQNKIIGESFFESH
jgi:hypothetical protein